MVGCDRDDGIGKAVFEQGLKLGQAAAEDYVKDFLKGCLKDGLAGAKPEVANKAVAKALEAFLKIVVAELEDQNLSPAEIRDRFEPVLVQFVKDTLVKPILGQAFEKDCRSIDVAELAAIWGRSNFKGKLFPSLPEEFDWVHVGKEYVKKIRKIVRETPELKSLLDTELLEGIARNTMQLSPGFDVAKYRESLHCSYGHLKLYAIDSTDREAPMKLWNMFIEQTVREALPPMRYELPSDLKRQLRDQGQLGKDLSAADLEQYRSDYFQQPLRKVLEAIGQSSVILGDPGAGKSTLLQYLALGWVEGKNDALPLLIELREYAIEKVDGFLEFLHRGRGADWQFDRQKLHEHLQEYSTLVMFDGLDEIFDRTTHSIVVDEIIRFSQQYPKAKILITSRIIGYNPDRLKQANFRHFTIQPLDNTEIHEFIDRWYTLALGNDPDKSRLVTRLKEAIANSKAIENLADNPLLLTMMAILNRRQELPRDRADLYDQASRVLLYHWDVDHKGMQLPMDSIGRREKQEMLRAIAYEMQAGEEGLKGNLITADRLTRILTDYLRDQGFLEPREKANGLINQLRHRNWILCDRGADTYGFVHRTFLEYFCAMEIVHRFEKQRSLSFEQLRDEVFGQHWQDETWHEVLKLICGAIEPLFASQLIDFMSDDIEEEKGSNFYEIWTLNLFLLAECLSEIKTNKSVLKVSKKIVDSLKELAEYVWFEWSQSTSAPSGIVQDVHQAIKATSSLWKDENSLETWLKELVEGDNWAAQDAAIKELVRNKRNDSEIFDFLKKIALFDYGLVSRREAITQLSEFFEDNIESLEIIKICAIDDRDSYLRASAIQLLTDKWILNSDIFDLLCTRIKSDPYSWEFEYDSDMNWLAEHYLRSNPRFVALQGISIHYPKNPRTIELLHDRASNDPHPQLREWAKEKLKLYNLE